MLINEITEAINPDLIKPGFQKHKSIDLDGEHYSLYIQTSSLPPKPEFVVKVFNLKKKLIGYVKFRIHDYEPSKRNWLGFKVPSKLDPYVVAHNINVASQFQRKGITTAVYKFVRALGNDIEPTVKR
jgi:hypothetical protein